MFQYILKILLLCENSLKRNKGFLFIDSGIIFRLLEIK